MDKLQKLHTLHNLAQLLKGGPYQLSGVPRTLRDSQLEPEAQALRDGYLAESIAKLAAADRDYQDALTAMNDAAEQQPAGLQQTVLATPCWTCRPPVAATPILHVLCALWDCTCASW